MLQPEERPIEPKMPPELDFFIALESRVWQALVEGDMEADANLLDPEFLGLYATGFATREDHVGQLRNGPVMESFMIHEARLLPLAPDTVLLAYRATYTPVARQNAPVAHAWYISSVWKLRGTNWVNIFSQDTVATDTG